MNKEKNMKSIKAILIMIVWTALSLAGLYYLGALDNYRNPLWIIPIGIALLGIHMINMYLYFALAGKAPYEWQKK